MLIITRRVGETTIMRDHTGLEVKVTVMGINGNQVRLGFDAPKSVNVVREEIDGKYGDNNGPK